MPNFYADEHEPPDILRLLDQAYDIEIGPQNAYGKADYHYTGVPCSCHGSTQYNTERKTWMDMLALEEVETQVGVWLQSHPNEHNRLVIEGVAEPAPKGMYIYSRAQGKNVMVAGIRGTQSGTYKAVMAWIRQAGKYLEIMQTSTLAASAIAIGAWYQADQLDEDEHHTFKRMFKTLNYSVNPQAQRILAASGKVPFGPVKAEAVAAKFGTAIRAWRAPVSEWVMVPGIGTKLAQDYLRGIGRSDV